MLLRLFHSFIITLCVTHVCAQDINLPDPVRSDGMSLNEALGQRRSVRSFESTRNISNQMLAGLLWAAVGVNRPDTDMRTNPTALNSREIDAYVFNADGVFRYEPKENKLIRKASGDYRKLVAGTSGFSQDYVLDAPVSIVLVADLGKFNGRHSAATMGAMDAGIACQNINLFCSANGLATVPRASMDKDGIVRLLGLGADQQPMLNNPVGYEK